MEAVKIISAEVFDYCRFHHYTVSSSRLGYAMHMPWADYQGQGEHSNRPWAKLPNVPPSILVSVLGYSIIDFLNIGYSNIHPCSNVRIFSHSFI